MCSFSHRNNRFFSWCLISTFVVLLVGVAVTKVADYDFWWHLNLGRQIFDKMTPVVVDQFSYTFSGAEQFNGEWLADLFIYLSYSLGGFGGVAVLKILLLSATFYLLAQVVCLGREQDNVTLVAVVLSLVVVLFALRFRLFIRPFLFSYLFLALFLVVLQKYRHDFSCRLLWILPVLEVIWANCSKGFFFGPLLVGLMAISNLLEGRRDKRIWALALLTLGASCLSPEGARLYSMLTAIMSDSRSTMFVGEQQSLTAQLLWGQSWNYFVGFQMLFAGSLVYLVAMKGWRNIFLLLVFLAFAIPPFFMVRMIDFFALIAFLPFYLFCEKLLVRFRLVVFLRSNTAIGGMSVLLLCLLLYAVPNNSTYAFGIGPKEKNTPVGALAFLERNNVEGRLFNSYPYGGYLAWMSPKRKVFIDGRVNQLYPPDFHESYFRIIGEPSQWAAAEKAWGFTVAVLEYDKLSMGRHYPVHLATNPDWMPVYWDRDSVVYVKDIPKHFELIERYGYRVARPTFYDLEYLKHTQASSSRAETISGLNADIERDPNNQEVRLAKVYYLYNSNASYYRKEILAELDASLALEPDLAQEHSALGVMLLMEGNQKGALRAAEEALRINPADEGALYLLERLGPK